MAFNLMSDDLSGGLAGGQTRDLRDLMKDSACSNYDSITETEDLGGILQSSRTTVDNYGNIQAQFESKGHSRNPNDESIKCHNATETSLKPKRSLKPRNRGSLTPVRRAHFQIANKENE
jgi:hypothetical protein